MMAAMMFPSVAPTVALYSRHDEEPVRRRAARSSPPATSLAWASVGVLAFARRRRRGSALRRRARLGPRRTLGRRSDPPRRRRLRADAAQGRLSREVPQPARLPARLLARRARRAALQMGLRHGAWCIGCCWALMASLFALGVMSLAWMAFVAGLIAFEKLIPSRRAATYGTAASCSCSACSCSLAPDAIPALTIPGNGSMSRRSDDALEGLARRRARAPALSESGRIRCLAVALARRPRAFSHNAKLGRATLARQLLLERQAAVADSGDRASRRHAGAVAVGAVRRHLDARLTSFRRGDARA